MFTNHHSAKRKQMQIYANILNKRQLNADFIPCIGMGGQREAPRRKGTSPSAIKKVNYHTQQKNGCAPNVPRLFYTLFTLVLHFKSVKQV